MLTHCPVGSWALLMVLLSEQEPDANSSYQRQSCVGIWQAQESTLLPQICSCRDSREVARTWMRLDDDRRRGF
ncbi:uncharacterized protein BDZ99DRAFT_170678 [Mytilinidion resinicola]|uniref:Secreted protein n=1 Tax=Mytilinidion resinicola TaxID=574789 RepID=A0A6A6Y3F9_9PEZI|nr:uncharacterized protein BDZ99DRAFT_170678 [Mytilinidion resinicola]KAF2803312.1 hypothetical protein BDZ99DRAFT_170678 [Mytilinidion resinicola]